MTTLNRIKTDAFKEECEAARGCYFHTTPEWEAYRATHTYRQYLRENIDRDVYLTADAKMADRACVRKSSTVADLEAELSVAARAAYLDGATRDQISYLAKLAFAAGDRTGICGARLTKREASSLISSYLSR